MSLDTIFEDGFFSGFKHEAETTRAYFCPLVVLIMRHRNAVFIDKAHQRDGTVADLAMFPTRGPAAVVEGVYDDVINEVFHGVLLSAAPDLARMQLNHEIHEDRHLHGRFTLENLH